MSQNQIPAARLVVCLMVTPQSYTTSKDRTLRIGKPLKRGNFNLPPALSLSIGGAGRLSRAA